VVNPRLAFVSEVCVSGSKFHVEVAPRDLKLETRNAESTDRGFQCDFGLHGVGNQTIMLRFFNEFLRTGWITA
jgi:hypothetical protein